jgi:formiminoglutamase
MLSKNNNYCFNAFSQSDLTTYHTTRGGEKRIGDTLLPMLAAPSAKFIILGISESIGPMANRGKAGAENTFESFLPSFLSMQDFNHDCACIGYVKWLGAEKKTFTLSNYVVELDEFVLTILLKYVQLNQIPILIGGGHNNALPLIKWANLKYGKIDVLNFDAHADCRAMEERHSGNSFSYAISEKLIEKYHVFGLHKAYLNSFSHRFMIDNGANFTFYENYLDGNGTLASDIEDLITIKGQDSVLGIEIDLDCIADMPSSAVSPSGWHFDEIRRSLRKLAHSTLKIVYLNLTEAAPISDLEKKKVGKALAYLVRDFIE